MLVLRKRTAAVRMVLGMAVAALIGVATAAPAAADPRAEQERVDQEAAEAAAVLEYATEQARAAAARYATATAELPEAEARVDEARGAVVAAGVAARTAEREEGQARHELAAAADWYEESSGVVTDARDQVAAFAVAAYKGSAVASFNLLLGARGPSEMIDRLGYVEQVSTAQREALDQLAGARLDARQAENDAAIAHDRAQRAREAAAAALAEAEAAEAAAEAAAAEVEELAQTRAEALTVAEAERDESLDRYEQAEAEAARIAEAVRQWEEAQRAAAERPAGAARAESPVLAPPDSPLAMPTKGWLSSMFGMRHDPFFQIYQLHSGVDIAAGGGTPVYAAERGKVITAGWNGGYGNYTCLGHGDHDGQGLSTCYAHQSEILVSVGESVERGELIGRVGTTGASTGNHLHFEVRLDGSPTDPVPFLPGF